MSHSPLVRNIASMIVAASVATILTAAPQTTNVDRLLAAARQALGDRAGVPAVRTFRIKGSIKTMNPGESGAFEINCELPDKFVILEERTYVTPGEVVTEPTATGASALHASTRLGFNGMAAIYERIRDDKWFVADIRQPPTQAQARVHLPEARAEFAHITLGLFAASFAGLPLHFSEAPGAKVATSVLVGGTGFSGTLTFNRQTHLPERLERVHNRDYLSAALNAVRPSRLPLNEIRYEDYRDVSGRKVPFRITNGREALNVTEFLVNVDIAGNVFRPSGR